MFFRFSAHTKSTIDSSVSRLSNIILSDWLILTGEFKIKSIICLLLLVFNLAFTALKTESNFLVQSPLFLAFVPIFVFLEVHFVIDKLSMELKQTVPYYVNRLMTKGVMIDINCNPLVELKIILLLCRGVLFCVSSEIYFRYLTTSSFRRSRSSPLNRFTKHSLRN